MANAAELNKKVDILWEMMFPGATVANEIAAPVPVRYYRDKSTGNMKDVLESSGRELFEKIGEGVMEAAMAYGGYIAADDDAEGKLVDDVGLELMDAAFAIYTALECLGFTEIGRKKLCQKVYEKNKARGYYGEVKE